MFEAENQALDAIEASAHIPVPVIGFLRLLLGRLEAHHEAHVALEDRTGALEQAVGTKTQAAGKSGPAKTSEN